MESMDVRHMYCLQNQVGTHENKTVDLHYSVVSICYVVRIQGLGSSENIDVYIAACNVNGCGPYSKQGISTIESCLPPQRGTPWRKGENCGVGGATYGGGQEPNSKAPDYPGGGSFDFSVSTAYSTAGYTPITGHELGGISATSSTLTIGWKQGAPKMGGITAYRLRIRRAGSDDEWQVIRDPLPYKMQGPDFNKVGGKCMAYPGFMEPRGLGSASPNTWHPAFDFGKDCDGDGIADVVYMKNMDTSPCSKSPLPWVKRYRIGDPKDKGKHSSKIHSSLKCDEEEDLLATAAIGEKVGFSKYAQAYKIYFSSYKWVRFSLFVLLC
jgi:hypothetical protein